MSQRCPLPDQCAAANLQNELEMSCMTGMSAGRCPFEDLTDTALAPQSRGVDDGGPARNLAADIGCKLVRPALERIEPQRAQPLHRLRCMHRRLRSARELFDHRPRRADGRPEAEPQAGVEVRYPRFR